MEIRERLTNASPQPSVFQPSRSQPALTCKEPSVPALMANVGSESRLWSPSAGNFSLWRERSREGNPKLSPSSGAPEREVTVILYTPSPSLLPSVQLVGVCLPGGIGSGGRCCPDLHEGLTRLEGSQLVAQGQRLYVSRGSAPPGPGDKHLWTEGINQAKLWV